ncbi:MAG: hypothetical protein IJN64_11005 [Lachnospiraceae bacterium]|nr:hypothetical protein [Lachnospiraceae bacterium]
MLDMELEKILEEIDLTKEAPTKEPERQYYYIKKMQGILAEQEEKKGRKLTACAQTFGCQMNFTTLISKNRINRKFQKMTVL